MVVVVVARSEVLVSFFFLFSQITGAAVTGRKTSTVRSACVEMEKRIHHDLLEQIYSDRIFEAVRSFSALGRERRKAQQQDDRVRLDNVLSFRESSPRMKSNQMLH